MHRFIIYSANNFCAHFHNKIGSDELSTAFSKLINDHGIRSQLESDNFVAIKVQSDSEAYIQFAQICKVSSLGGKAIFHFLCAINL